MDETTLSGVRFLDADPALRERIGNEWVALRDAEVEAFKQGHLPRAHAGAPGAAAVMVATRYCVGVRAGLY